MTYTPGPQFPRLRRGVTSTGLTDDTGPTAVAFARARHNSGACRQGSVRTAVHTRGLLRASTMSQRQSWCWGGEDRSLVSETSQRHKSPRHTDNVAVLQQTVCGGEAQEQRWRGPGRRWSWLAEARRGLSCKPSRQNREGELGNFSRAPQPQPHKSQPRAFSKAKGRQVLTP